MSEAQCPNNIGQSTTWRKPEKEKLNRINIYGQRGSTKREEKSGPETNAEAEKCTQA